MNQAGRDRHFLIATVLLGKPHDVTLVRGLGVHEPDRHDVQVAGGELDIPRFVSRRRLGRQTEVEIAHGEFARLTHGAVAHDALRRVVAAVGEQAFDHSLAVQIDLFDDSIATLDDERLDALRVLVHDVERDCLVAVIGDPVPTVEQQNTIDSRRRRILVVVRKKERFRLVVLVPGIKIDDPIKSSVSGRDVGIEV